MSSSFSMTSNVYERGNLHLKRKMGARSILEAAWQYKVSASIFMDASGVQQDDDDDGHHPALVVFNSSEEVRYPFLWMDKWGWSLWPDSNHRGLHEGLTHQPLRSYTPHYARKWVSKDVSKEMLKSSNIVEKKYEALAKYRERARGSWCVFMSFHRQWKM